MIIEKYYCDHCKKEIDGATYENNKIRFQWEDRNFQTTTSYSFCDKCRKELANFVDRDSW